MGESTMQDDDKKTAAEKQAELILAQQRTNEPHKHHMLALTISFVILAVIIGVSITFLVNSTS